MEMIKAFLLSAGLGTRLRPLTDRTPKCLLPINGKPLLEIWLDHLRKYNVDKVLVNTHWRHEKVERFIEEVGKLRSSEDKKNKKWPDVKLFYESELLGSGGTLLAKKDWVSDGQPFFILYGDNLTNVNLLKMYDFHNQHDLLFTIGVFKADEPERCGIVEIDENSLVVDFVEKPNKPRSDLAAAGIYLADKRLFDFFPKNLESIHPLDLGFHVMPNLVRKMKAYFIEEFLMDIGTPESYEKAQKIYPQIKQSNAD